MKNIRFSKTTHHVTSVMSVDGAELRKKALEKRWWMIDLFDQKHTE